MTMRSDYLAFGGHPIAAALDVSGTLAFLRGQHESDPYLGRAREAVATADQHGQEFTSLDGNHCDFCFITLVGGEYERLADGRERCIRCSRTALRSGEEFEKLFLTARRDMEAAFGISLMVPIKVRMVNAREIARRTNERFEPTPGVDARVLGFAEQNRDGYALYIENGSPRLAALSTLAHELTHIWQYRNWNVDQITQRYGEEHQLAVYEGMAAWAQVQFLRFMHEDEYARRQEGYLRQREDEYGVGFHVFAERYPLGLDAGGDADSPFRHAFPL